MIVSLENISWERRSKLIINDVSWQIKKGEHWCLFGLNGSGKTTLLNIINGYIWPTTGSVTVLGKKFGEYDLRELRKEIGWVSNAIQERFPRYETSLNIVLSGKFATIGLFDKVTDADVDSALTVMKLLNCENLTNKRYEILSHGEKQRILIARALMANPKILILDEPCTGLDFLARERLLATVETLAKAKDELSLIYVTHHVEEILPCFTKTFLIKNGQSFSKGKTKNQFTTENISRFFGTEVFVTKNKGRFKLSLP